MMHVGCNRYEEEDMENEAGHFPNGRGPPKSKFNDEEATAVLRLIVEQERILKNATASPVLNITADKPKRLPPLGTSLRESFEGDSESEPSTKYRNQTQHQGDSLQDAVLRKPTLIRGKEPREMKENHAVSLGKPKVPEIFSTPKIARPRDKERPRGSYGRVPHSKPNNPLEDRAFSSLDSHVERPSNPIPFEMKDNMKPISNTRTSQRTSDFLNDELMDRPICPQPPRANSPLPYMN